MAADLLFLQSPPRETRVLYNDHDSGIGRVNTWTGFTVRIGLAGRTVSVGFRSATVATWDRDFFMYGADRPDLPDEWTLYRIEDEITGAWLPQFRARLGAGQDVEFGEVTLSPEGVRCRRQAFPWQRVAGAEYKVRNPAPGEKDPGTGTRLHLYVREPGRSDDDETAWPEVVIPSLEIDYADALIKLVSEQPTSYRATDKPALSRGPAGSVHAEPVHQRVKQPGKHPELGVSVEEPERGRDAARAFRYPCRCPSEPRPRLFPLSGESQVDAHTAHRAGVTVAGPVLPGLYEPGMVEERAPAVLRRLIRAGGQVHILGQ
jgi:hypothetical protein